MLYTIYVQKYKDFFEKPSVFNKKEKSSYHYDKIMIGGRSEIVHTANVHQNYLSNNISIK